MKLIEAGLKKAYWQERLKMGSGFWSQAEEAACC